MYNLYNLASHPHKSLLEKILSCTLCTLGCTKLQSRPFAMAKKRCFLLYVLYDLYTLPSAPPKKYVPPHSHTPRERVIDLYDLYTLVYNSYNLKPHRLTFFFYKILSCTLCTLGFANLQWPPFSIPKKTCSIYNLILCGKFIFENFCFSYYYFFHFSTFCTPSV